MKLSPIDTAFEGFRIIRDRPGLILAWTGFYLLSLLAMIVILLVPNIGTLATVEATGVQRGYGEILARYGPSALLVVPLAMAMLIMLVTAVYRTVLNPEDKGFAHLKVSADELRMFLVSLLVIFIFALASGLYGTAVVLAANASGEMQGLVTKAGSVGGAVLLCWLMVRLALAGVMTFAEHHFRLGAAWRLTKGQFWRLLLTLGLTILYVVLIVIVALTLGLVLAKVTGGLSLMGQLASHDLTHLTLGLGLAIVGELLLQLGLQALLIVLVFVIFYAPPAAAYRRLKAPVE
ncbi:MAG: hypothetical protein HY859_17710 [Caulobacterales bacterium]|nr:hypothetical protein [Caulobacterales bacterium]